MNPPRFIQGIISEDEGWFWQSAPSDTWEFDMLGTYLPHLVECNHQMLFPFTDQESSVKATLRNHTQIYQSCRK